MEHGLGAGRRDHIAHERARACAGLARGLDVRRRRAGVAVERSLAHALGVHELVVERSAPTRLASATTPGACARSPGRVSAELRAAAATTATRPPASERRSTPSPSTSGTAATRSTATCCARTSCRSSPRRGARWSSATRRPATRCASREHRANKLDSRSVRESSIVTSNARAAGLAKATHGDY